MWQNRCFIYIAMFLLTSYHHNNGFVNSIMTAKPYVKPVSVLTNRIHPK